MSNAEQRCKEYFSTINGFIPKNEECAYLDGYEQGRADAWDLPEVRAEELILGKSYEATNRDGEVRCCFAGMMKGGKTYVFFCGNPNEHLADDYSFRGPLPLGRVE